MRSNEGKEFTATTLAPDTPFATAVALRATAGSRTRRRPAPVASFQVCVPTGSGITSCSATSLARDETLFFVDGRLASRVAERLEPKNFVVGNRGDYKDLFLSRSALNADEVAALHAGKMLKGSLEIYSPLTDADFKADGTVENRAQSLTAFKVGRDAIVHIDETTSTR